MKRAVIYTDGACSGNPGPAGIGVVIHCDGTTIEIAEYIGNTTNNVAEYTALLRGLKEAQDMGVDEVAVNMDSELAIKQIKGLYKVKNAGLKPLFKQAMQLLSSFSKHSARHVPREQNTHADRLSKQGVDPSAPPMKKITPPPHAKPSNGAGTLDPALNTLSQDNSDKTTPDSPITKPGGSGRGQGSLPF